MRRRRLVWTSFLLLALAIHGNANSQARPNSGQDPHPTPFPPTNPIGDGNTSEAERRAMVEMEKKANLERQAALKSDTDKLLKLAEELKKSVDKSSENVLSLDVVKKAEEIEKLAHSVKDKMKGPK